MPKTVFISYSHLNADVVNRLKQDLRTHGVRVWIDHESLTPGTRSWEIAIRQGIQAVDAVLYLASPDALQSNNVQGELDVAESEHKPVIPIWVAGDHWVRAVPMAMTRMQYLDARGDRYPQALAALLKLLEGTDPPPPPPPPNPWDEIAIPADLYDLGFRGWRVRATKVEFILPPVCAVAGGPFVMGSAPDDTLASDDEKPQYRIPVAAFEIGTFPVTVAEYGYYLKANPTIAPPTGEDDDQYGWKQQQRRYNHPVVRATWFNATAYAVWLAQVTGRGWRLPTEAEWEKAARWDPQQQVARVWPWGNEFGDGSRANTREKGPRMTTPVGKYPVGASPCGALDMAGNVWELCSSLYKPYPYDASTSESTSDRTNVRLRRGGSWNGVASYARAAYRGNYRPGSVGDLVGFRLACRAGAGSN